jgi:hypothetical protein
VIIPIVLNSGGPSIAENISRISLCAVADVFSIGSKNRANGLHRLAEERRNLGLTCSGPNLTKAADRSEAAKHDEAVIVPEVLIAGMLEYRMSHG